MRTPVTVPDGGSQLHHGVCVLNLLSTLCVWFGTGCFRNCRSFELPEQHLSLSVLPGDLPFWTEGHKLSALMAIIIGSHLQFGQRSWFIPKQFLSLHYNISYIIFHFPNFSCRWFPVLSAYRLLFIKGK